MSPARRGGEQVSPARRQRASTVGARQRDYERSERGAEQINTARRQRASTVGARQRDYERSERGGEQVSTARTGPQLWRMLRLPALVVAVVVVGALFIGLAQARVVRGELDPDAVDPAGSHALALLVDDLEIDVGRPTTNVVIRGASALLVARELGLSLVR